MFSICAWCEEKSCEKENEEYPEWCMIPEKDWFNEIAPEYEKEENSLLFKTAAHVETTGYKKWPRLKEIAEFADTAGYETIGIAFCIGLKREAKIAADYYKEKGFKVASAVCCCGSFDKAKLDIPPEDRFSETGFEAACNPIGQAKFLEESGSEFNIVLGLCVGHDSLFFKHSSAPTTVLAVKDRVLAHNPLGAVYCRNSYYSDLD
ncbi:MAG: DUF1847 domain-containing protein [Bacillota bacterium]